MLGVSGGPVVTNSCVYFHFTREAAGGLGARHSPRPFGAERNAQLGRFTPRECGLISLNVIARSNATKQSSFLTFPRKESWIASSHPPSPEGGLRRTRELLAVTVGGCLKIESTIVVPANAGTHNHRERVMRKSLNSVFQTKGRGVWVPAFAGTTLRD
jgi:hypothetical protein